jgi:hypothetical protein
MLNTFLQYYGTEILLGIILQTSLENLKLELGVIECPLCYGFQKWGCLAINSWIKTLWGGGGKIA